MSLNALSKEIHASNHKWWHDLDTGAPLQRNKGELLCLVHSELSEAYEGARFQIMDDHLPTRPMFHVELADAVIRIHDYCGGFGYDLEIDADIEPVGVNVMKELLEANRAISKVMEGERKGNRDAAELWLAIAMRRIHTFCAKLAIPLDTIVAEKREYNAHRQDHSIKSRRAAGGKKW